MNSRANQLHWVEWLLEMLNGDTTEAEILADYPDLEPADLQEMNIQLPTLNIQ
jgi:uncharacterized protein (DUF433 family)